MRLVKIDGIYINVDRVDGLSGSYIHGNTTRDTNIFVGGSKQPFIVRKNIDEVVATIEADTAESEE
ncbi:MAG: hypothetical protein J5521_04530 [Lachnospiraceae bacterium]|nr:hypothetical protein [Lachnospiraceae bacterium]MBR4414783.1 hypothetical protein [Aeriscardovia sp.]